MRHPLSSSWPAQKAIARPLEAHGGLIYTLGRRLCGAPEDAEDLVQETFFAAFRNWEHCEGRAAPRTWLHTIATRACQRMHRRRAGEPRHVARLSEVLPSDDNRVPVLPTAGEGPDLGLLRNEARQTVERAIGTIPLPFRLPLVLQEIADFSPAEIAEIPPFPFPPGSCVLDVRR
jgi:RNA polymerase sigma-70 factor (ECF subfamily)